MGMGWASVCSLGSDHSDLEPGPNPLRSIFTPRASRAERRALGVKPRSCATRLSSAAGTGSPTNAARRNSIASALAVRVSVPAVSALVIVTYGVGTPSLLAQASCVRCGDSTPGLTCERALRIAGPKPAADLPDRNAVAQR